MATHIWVLMSASTMYSSAHQGMKQAAGYCSCIRRVVKLQVAAHLTLQPNLLTNREQSSFKLGLTNTLALPPVLAAAHAFEEERGRLICRTNLDFLKVSLIVVAFAAHHCMGEILSAACFSMICLIPMIRIMFPTASKWVYC